MPDLTNLTGPPGPVQNPADCPGYGRELPSGWRCPPGCPLARECFEAYAAPPDDCDICRGEAAADIKNLTLCEDCANAVI